MKLIHKQKGTIAMVGVEQNEVLHEAVFGKGGKMAKTGDGRDSLDLNAKLVHCSH